MANCPHGFPQGQCLICSTLSRSQTATQVAEKTAKTKAAPAQTAKALYPAPPQGNKQFSAASEKPEGQRRGRHRLVTVVLVIVVGLLAWGLLQGVLGLALHIAEYVAVALLAGWVGYRAGHWRARHEREQR